MSSRVSGRHVSRVTLGELVLRERIGEGGGAVYRCEQPLLGRQAVVKVPRMREAVRTFFEKAKLYALTPKKKRDD